MNIKTYLDKHDIKVTEFAKLIGAHRTTVHNWLSGKSVPNKKTMKEISRLTYGKVTPNDYFL